ncbi:GMC family oxidoreductase N-terminal domain-containing protein [Micromonospora fiedleri]|uniref:GMC family oxidoreductase N-terminal domain-containing protein n=1 Tax=Micromonospora fiedleri TaxID=1157498 RepID=A0ABS1UPR3_9ACTN|nr:MULTISPECIES: GMC family oxidoreductase N-terminal domain-containing protein [Micromonospora]MBL6278337.1 GMC family oxidoreductase N-terminal domain-containing protein [Micromonospora fiedleri]WSK41426.1 GMC family oxidoreductase N-terminal domain-containing protein [Micromonospora maris]
MYDYVVVGAGSAGCIIAARLTEDPDVTVCLIEAGPEDSAPNIKVPAAFSKLFRTEYDWDYSTHDEPALAGRRVYLPRGRGLGGSSSINAMVYVRGNRIDYDGWGQPGWSYDELMPYFLRSEDNERGASPYHGVGGPLRISDGRSRNVSCGAFVEAATEAGYAANDDFNGPQQEGFGFFQVTQRDGRRWSTADAFLRPALDRPNLVVETNLQVHRVLISDGRATGVTGRRHGAEVTIEAGREVILAAGAYNSPHLLMHSGIGPADLLRALGIEVVLDQPEVGQNLQDHLLIPLNYVHSQPVSLLVSGAPENVQLFMEQGQGPLCSNGPEAGGFVRTRADLPGPDVEFFAAPIMFVDSGLAPPTAHALSCGPVLLNPASRGAVTLASDDPTAKPRIQHNYLTDPADVQTAVAAVRIGMEIARQPAMRPYAESLDRAPASESDRDLADYARRYAHSIFHAAGSCALGRVVDPELRVLGIDGLRVADASVLPTVTRGNPHASVIMVGEKAADLIRGGATVPVPATAAAAG